MAPICARGVLSSQALPSSTGYTAAEEVKTKAPVPSQRASAALICAAGPAAGAGVGPHSGLACRCAGLAAGALGPAAPLGSRAPPASHAGAQVLVNCGAPSLFEKFWSWLSLLSVAQTMPARPSACTHLSQVVGRAGGRRGEEHKGERGAAGSVLGHGGDAQLGQPVAAGGAGSQQRPSRTLGLHRAAKSRRRPLPFHWHPPRLLARARPHAPRVVVGGVGLARHRAGAKPVDPLLAQAAAQHAGAHHEQLVAAGGGRGGHTCGAAGGRRSWDWASCEPVELPLRAGAGGEGPDQQRAQVGAVAAAAGLLPGNLERAHS